MNFSFLCKAMIYVTYTCKNKSKMNIWTFSRCIRHSAVFFCTCFKRAVLIDAKPVNCRKRYGEEIFRYHQARCDLCSWVIIKLMLASLPGKHGAFIWCCFNVGPASKTVDQHWNSIGWMPSARWVASKHTKNNISTTSAQRLRRWSTKLMLYTCFVFTG